MRRSKLIAAGSAVFLMASLSVAFENTESYAADEQCYASTPRETPPTGVIAPTESGGVYRISTKPELLWMSWATSSSNTGVAPSRATARDADFVLTANVSLDDCSWVPIGMSDGFTGSLDGGGYSISGLKAVGTFDIGLFGQLRGDVKNLEITDIDLVGTAGVGGLAGEFSAGTVSSVRASGVVSGVENVGGLIGRLGRGVVEKSSFSGVVEGAAGTAPGRIGGLVGLLDEGQVRYSRASGEVIGQANSRYVGGLVGWSFDSVNDSYSLADVTGAENVGGLLGEFWGTTLARTFSVGSVLAPAATRAGGLVGSFQSGTVTASFWDSLTSNQASSAAGTAADTASMQSLALFTTAGWAIVDGWEEFDPVRSKIWGICPGDSYPFLLWEHNADPCSALSGESSATEGATEGSATRTGDEAAALAATGPKPARIWWGLAGAAFVALVGVIAHGRGRQETAVHF